MPVPGPIMMIGIGGIGRQAEGVRLLDIDSGSCRPGSTRSARKVEATPSRVRLPMSVAHRVDRQRQRGASTFGEDEIE